MAAVEAGLARRSIVVALDMSPESAEAIREAARIATWGHNATLHAVHVVARPLKGWTRTVRLERQESILEQMPSVIEDFVTTILRNQDDPPNVRVHVRMGDPVEEILQVALDVDASMLVAGTHGRTGWHRILEGSIAEALIRRAHCPVLVARPKDYASVSTTETSPDEQPRLRHP